MPFYVFSELNTDRDSETDTTAGQSLDRSWECVVDTVVVSAAVIAALATQEGVFKGSVHPNYTYATCTRVRAKAEPKDPFRFQVYAFYREPAPQPGNPINPASGQPSPPNRPPWTRGSFRREDVFRTKDLDGQAYVNTAGDPFENPPPIPQCVGQFVVTKWYDAISYTALKAYENKRNSDVWQGFPLDSLCIMGVEWEPKTERSWVGWEVRFTVEHRDVTPEQQAIFGAAPTGGFHPVPVLDAGFYEKVADADGGVDKKIPYRTNPPSNNDPKTVPGLLDGLTGRRTQTGNPGYKGFKQHNAISFAILN